MTDLGVDEGFKRGIFLLVAILIITFILSFVPDLSPFVAAPGVLDAQQLLGLSIAVILAGIVSGVVPIDFGDLIGKVARALFLLVGIVLLVFILPMLPFISGFVTAPTVTTAQQFLGLVLTVILADIVVEFLDSMGVEL